MIAIASVRHTGTRFLSELLDNPLRVHFGERYLDRVRGLKVVTPLRRLDSIIESWGKRQLDMEDLHRSLAQMVSYPVNFYLPVDSPRRDDYLDALSNYTGMELNTDWMPVTDNHGSRNEVFIEPGWADRIHTDYSDWFEQFYA